MAAAGNGKFEAVVWLSRQAAVDPFAKSDDGFSPSDLARRAGHRQVQTYLDELLRKQPLCPTAVSCISGGASEALTLPSEEAEKINFDLDRLDQLDVAIELTTRD